MGKVAGILILEPIGVGPDEPAIWEEKGMGHWAGISFRDGDEGAFGERDDDTYIEYILPSAQCIK